jgi:2-keto-3-deoxy-L-rhamnonate aldolase RhmA
MRPNRLRQLLRDGKPSICARVDSVWPSVVEIIGQTGAFDYVEFAAEYAPFDLHDLDGFCRAAEICGLSTMIKIDQEPRLFLAERAVGAGFSSVLFADCRCAEDVRQCVRAIRPDTPQDGGLFGAMGRRFAYGTPGGSPEYVQALRDVVVAIMIEKQPAIMQLEEILSVPGVDMVQWGPSDYSMSAGLLGQRNSDEVRTVGRRVFEMALRAGVQPRAELESLDDVRYYLDMGVRHFRIGTDLAILSRFWKQNGSALRELLE